MPDPPRRSLTDANAEISFNDERVWPLLIIGFGSVIAITVVQMTTGFLTFDRFGYRVEDAAQNSAVCLFCRYRDGLRSGHFDPAPQTAASATPADKSSFDVWGISSSFVITQRV
ncbi:hypothetical protein SLH49_21085 [Cognatiyoonia sp. IB215446]|uniref:hypothetical protein n=1 Tax=Cognatiyoonia sp. IB215446 TaxID=3097355 RepID=UPI002A0D6B61|nr:hypothetical protein [Cognatiyoonia sp. IB215446]MDX8350492.1 hypothetical protein [Cognatiyoonia sp. IB215446]